MISLADKYPELLSEWNYEKNSLNPYEINVSYRKKVWWKCKNNHDWEATVVSRCRKNPTGCPYCNNQKLLSGFNDLKTRYPEIARDWAYDKNGDLKPEMFFPGTSKKVWWICSNNHYYLSSINSRTNLGSGCAYCKNKKVLKGYNDLESQHPELMNLWDYEKNNEINLFPDNVTSISGKKAWWKCEKGHEWFATIAHITYGRRCPYCNVGNSTSFPEQAIFYYLSKYDNSCINRYKLNGHYEIDIYIKSKNVGIEYDGYRWHSDFDSQQKDFFKNYIFEDNSIEIIRIKEISKREFKFETGDFIQLNYNEYNLNDDDYIALGLVISDLIKRIFNKNIDIDIEKDRNEIYENYLLVEKNNSFAVNNKELLKYWDSEKNGYIKPEYISRSSGKIVWWKCEKGHSFKASVHSINQGLNCLECKREYYKKRGFDITDDNYLKTLRIENDVLPFTITNPELLDEWDYIKNGNVLPNNIIPGSSKLYWWKCSICGNEWKSSVVNRIKGHGCRKCGYKKISNLKNKVVLQFSKQGEFIKEYNSVNEAIKLTGVKHISCVCRGDRKTAGGFIWKYKNK